MIRPVNTMSRAALGALLVLGAAGLAVLAVGATPGHLAGEAQEAAGTPRPLDAYVSKPEAVYKWRDTGHVISGLIFGGEAHILNVTSLEWMDTTRAAGPNGAVWTHQVAVVVPKKITITNISMAVMTGGCNRDAGNGTGPKPPGKGDEYLNVADALAAATGGVCIIIYQIPNCPVIYPSDPSHAARDEDSLIAWAWKEFIDDPKHDPEWLPRLPMAKAGFQCMRATQDFLKQKGIADVKGWIVSGASKRGWTSWMVGAATCAGDQCVEVVGIAPLVPIVPSLVKEVHRQWMSYGGFTWAFTDYIAANLTQKIDSPVFQQALEIIDPMYYGERLARIPKVVVLSSDDEFMQMDWSNIWYDDLTGEKHLLIAPNSEHSLATGIPEVVECMSTVFCSIAAGRDTRPNFEYSVDNSTGAISVTIPAGVPHGKVVLRHVQTMSTERRDFRWIRLADDDTRNCTLPGIKIPPVAEGGGNCVQPMVWLGKTLSPDASSGDGPTTYTATPPEPK